MTVCIGRDVKFAILHSGKCPLKKKIKKKEEEEVEKDRMHSITKLAQQILTKPSSAPFTTNALLTWCLQHLPPPDPLHTPPNPLILFCFETVPLKGYHCIYSQDHGQLQHVTCNVDSQYDSNYQSLTHQKSKRSTAHTPKV